ncbi:MAG TPA: AAA family ATPase [Solirubrobacteraceae bacterium]|jgi:chromosome partitioning protein
MSTVVTIAQQKGGVGKTTTARELVVLLAQRGERVLAVDVDPQFALTRQLGIKTRDLPLSIVDVLAGRADARDAIVGDIHDVDVLPGSRELAGVELALVGQVGRELFLRDALGDVGGDYDWIVIDTPPNLGLLTVNALMPATTVIAPVSAEDEGAAQGVIELRGTLEKLKRLRSDDAELLVVLTKVSTSRLRPRITAVAIEDAITAHGFAIAARIPNRAAVHKAAIARTPLAIREPDGLVASAYGQLAATLAGAGERRMS